MASIFLKDGVYVARFRHHGREYKRSLKTGGRQDAELALVEITRVILRLRLRLMSVPDGVSVPDFVLSCGTLTAPVPEPTPDPDPPTVPTLAEAVAQYLQTPAHLAPTTERGGTFLIMRLQGLEIRASPSAWSRRTGTASLRR